MNSIMQNKINEVRMASIGMADTLNNMLMLRYCSKPVAGEDTALQPVKCTLTIDKTGGGSSLLRVTVTQHTMDETGTAAASTTYIYDGAAGGSGTVTAVTETLGELVYELRKIPGMVAYRKDAAADYSLATNDFIDMAATDIPRVGWLKALYRDVSEIYYSAVRIGVPEFKDFGAMRILSISGTCTGVTGTPVLSISRDDNDEDSGGEKLVQNFVLAAAQTKYIDSNILEAMTVQGPILVEITSSDLSAANIVIQYVNASV